MLNTCRRTAIAAAILCFNCAVVSAATLDMWVNKTGDTTHAPVIKIKAGQTINLTVYFQTTGVGGPSQVGGMLTWDKTTNALIGAGATPSGNGISYVGGSFAYSPTYAAYNFLNGSAGGSGSTSNGVTRYGYYADTFLPTGSMPSAEGTPKALYSVTLSVSPTTAAGSYPLTIWVDPSSTLGPFSSYVFDANGNYTKATAYTANLLVITPTAIQSPP